MFDASKSCYFPLCPSGRSSADPTLVVQWLTATSGFSIPLSVEERYSASGEGSTRGGTMVLIWDKLLISNILYYQ